MTLWPISCANVSRNRSPVMSEFELMTKIGGNGGTHSLIDCANVSRNRSPVMSEFELMTKIGGNGGTHSLIASIWRVSKSTATTIPPASSIARVTLRTGPEGISHVDLTNLATVSTLFLYSARSIL